MIKKLAMTVAVAVAAAFAVACGSKEDKAASVEGEWELVDVEFATKSAVVGSNGLLNGTYSDGKNWGCPYKVSRDGDTLVMVSFPDGKDSYTYRKCTIPEEVKKNS